jgi:hypothetical protein
VQSSAIRRPLEKIKYWKSQWIGKIALTPDLTDDIPALNFEVTNSSFDFESAELVNGERRAKRKV